MNSVEYGLIIWNIYGKATASLKIVWTTVKPVHLNDDGLDSWNCKEPIHVNGLLVLWTRPFSTVKGKKSSWRSKLHGPPRNQSIWLLGRPLSYLWQTWFKLFFFLIKTWFKLDEVKLRNFMVLKKRAKNCYEFVGYIKKILPEGFEHLHSTVI